MPAIRKKQRATVNQTVSQVRLLHRLARRHGIQPVYRDEAGSLRVVSRTTLQTILKLLGTPAATPQLKNAIAESQVTQWYKLVDDTLVLRQADLSDGWSLHLPLEKEQLAQTTVTCRILGEQNFCAQQVFTGAKLAIQARKRIHGRSFLHIRLPFPRNMRCGYFTLHVRAQALTYSQDAQARLIITPDVAFCQSPIQRGRRLWGLTLQLYGLRTKRNWGIGDFGDLKKVMAWAGRGLGAAMVGVNPLHALLPGEISPYSPSSRLFHNPLYLNIEQIPDFVEHVRIRRLVASKAFQRKLRTLRESHTVQYSEVRSVKMHVLERLFQHFHDVHLSRRTRRGRAFEQFVNDQGHDLERFACFQVMHEVFARGRKRAQTWRDWPQPFRDPCSKDVRAFSLRYRRRVNFYRYLEWQCQQQLQEVRLTAHRLKMPIGLYQDLAVGISPDGYDAWAFQHQLITEASIGTPPELFSPKGQNWDLVPLSPEHLHRYGYDMFVKTFQHVMAGGGLLRIDHVMGLFRLFWIPNGARPGEGAYVHYPSHALLGILALESHRTQTTIVGEDLGTVTPLIRRTLTERGLLSYRLLLFEKTKNGHFKPPGHYPREALVAVTTHDLPTLKGFWEGRDILWKERLGLYPDHTFAEKERRQRASEKSALLAALRKEDLLSTFPQSPAQRLPAFSPELSAAIHAYLARSPSMLLAISLEDLVGDLDTPNIPGAPPSRYPVWRMKAGRAGSTLESWLRNPFVRQIVQSLNRERGRRRKTIRKV